MIGNIEDDENDGFNLDGSVIKEYDWVELNTEDPSKPEVTVEPPSDIFESEENKKKLEIVTYLSFNYIDDR